jgi:hypothetical protein
MGKVTHFPNSRAWVFGWRHGGLFGNVCEESTHISPVGIPFSAAGDGLGALSSWVGTTRQDASAITLPVLEPSDVHPPFPHEVPQGPGAQAQQYVWSTLGSRGAQGRACIQGAGAKVSC